MNQGAWIVLVVLLVAGAFGAYRAATDGRFRGTRRVRSSGAGHGDQDHATSEGAVPDAEQDGGAGILTAADLGQPLGERATLVQFSSAFCAPCRATRRVLSDVAGVVPGVSHVEIDAEHHLELVRRVEVLRTPTTLVLDARGHEVTRATGALRKEQVLVALAEAVPGP